jgi:anti-sigma regulatory factor (Ser/Thr protein kinase)/biotin operon repressor
MSRVRERGEDVRRFLLERVQANPQNISKLAAEKFGISRQAVGAHLQRLVNEGALTVRGKTKGRTYALAPLVEWSNEYTLTEGPPEDVVWRTDIRRILGNLPDNVRDIWNYGFSEMFNNARDHSGGTTIEVAITKTAVTSQMMILDNGVGIFRKIQQELNLLDERHAIFELSKGKLTTDPRHHTGEGIFFTSRMFDNFRILSGGVFFSHYFGDEEDYLLQPKDPAEGTLVFLELGNHTSRTTKRIFDEYSDDVEYSFNKTVVPVKLAQYGNDKLISRSQAKRVLARVELFKTVMLDFKDVPTIGQAFADEMFRVFAREHPAVVLMPVHANSEVKRMITRAQSNTEPDVAFSECESRTEST